LSFQTRTKGLVEAAGMDLVLFVGKKENIGDYLRTPLGFKIGLIQVFWIMCFGASYSKLIANKRESTSFHIREEFQNGAAKAFVSTPSFDSYLNLEPHVQAMQRMEIGQELFHRLPVEEKKDGESGWIFNPKFILRFLIYFFRQKTTNWAKYQAAVVPKN
jgi:hypothetical protein